MFTAQLCVRCNQHYLASAVRWFPPHKGARSLISARRVQSGRRIVVSCSQLSGLKELFLLVLLGWPRCDNVDVGQLYWLGNGGDWAGEEVFTNPVVWSIWEGLLSGRFDVSVCKESKLSYSLSFDCGSCVWFRILIVVNCTQIDWNRLWDPKQFLREARESFVLLGLVHSKRCRNVGLGEGGDLSPPKGCCVLMLSTNRIAIFQMGKRIDFFYRRKQRLNQLISTKQSLLRLQRARIYLKRLGVENQVDLFWMWQYTIGTEMLVKAEAYCPLYAVPLLVLVVLVDA